MVIGTALGWSNLATIALAVALAFVFGYDFTMVPVLRAGLAFGAVFKLALAADTVSIFIMEVIDNLIMLAVPGAMDAGLDSLLFWGSLAVALLIAAAAAFPVNRWLIARGRGHAVVHAHHFTRGRRQTRFFVSHAVASDGCSFRSPRVGRSCIPRRDDPSRLI
jgi:hypothetical protein